jgi:hypothetical protein
MDDENAGRSEPSQSSAGGARDGLIDFGSYSIEQLRELQFSVDKEAFPLNFSNLIAALKKKEEVPRRRLRSIQYKTTVLVV